MDGKADITSLAQHRSGLVEESLSEWTSHAASGDTTEVVQNYFGGTGVGQVSRIGASSVIVKGHELATNRPTILVLGNHDLSELSQLQHAAAMTEPTTVAGPGIASRFAPTVAFTEGFLAARERAGEAPVNATFVSIGSGDTFKELQGGIFTGNVDAIFLTNAVAWNPMHPTITNGSRGVLTARLTLTAGEPTNDYLTAGALRNPLGKLTEMLGRLRDDQGRIALPGFYERAVAPTKAMRSALSVNEHDPNAWVDAIDTARPTGSLSATERAALWPVVSILDVSVDNNDQGRTTPSAASATLALYLIPDQRHVEVEAALRHWFISQSPPDLQPSLRVLSSNRPYRSPDDAAPVAAQSHAALRVFGRKPILVPAGGPAGAGEISYGVGAPVAFAGIAGPQHRFGSTTEAVPRSLYETGVAMAAETCLALRRR